ncbi:MAG: 2OG-Fe(II) oxygenase [Actinomycetota bacterium]
MTVEPVPFLVIENFLGADEHAQLLRFVVGEAEFAPAQVTEPGAAEGGADVTQRRSAVADADASVFDLFEDKLLALLPHARREVGVGRFTLGRVERQITAHTDGDFFTVHTDVGDVAGPGGSRRVSYVYYFNESPRSYEGGQLRFYDRLIGDDGAVGTAESFQTVEPLDNSIVFFPSDAMHEVEPVRVVGDADEPGTTRYTVNGWFHDADHVRPEPDLDPPTRMALTQRYTPSFTETGFEKVATPSAVHRALRALYDERVVCGELETPDKLHLPTGTPDFASIDDVGGMFQFALQSTHEDWCGVELEPTAACGLRVYRRGQTLIPHTDRVWTHVISSIVHIAHDTDEPWPLSIVDLDGVEHEVLLEEGEMLLYESARCPHARPVPLDGEAYCSLFLHYRPIGWNLTYRQLLDQAQADEATDILPPELWPPHLRPPENGVGDPASSR